MGQSKLLSKALCLSSSSALASLVSVVWFLWGDSPPILFSWPILAQDQLESVLEVLHRQTEQYRDQPQHLEKITCQQRLLQEDLVHIRAELCRESTVRGG